jgi:hypothetical protein
MSIILLLVGAFVSCFETGESCIDALHQLRNVERLEIVATDVLEDSVLAFTLSDSPRVLDKTALLICQRDLDDVPEDDPDIVDEGEAPMDEPDDPTGDDTSETEGVVE